MADREAWHTGLCCPRGKCHPAGPPGVGKTHLAAGLVLKALNAGMVVYYTTLSHIITDLKKAQLQGRMERRWRVYLCLAVLVIDEVGYMQLNRQEAELLSDN